MLLFVNERIEGMGWVVKDIAKLIDFPMNMRVAHCVRKTKQKCGYYLKKFKTIEKLSKLFESTQHQINALVSLVAQQVQCFPVLKFALGFHSASTEFDLWRGFCCDFQCPTLCVSSPVQRQYFFAVHRWRIVSPDFSNFDCFVVSC